MLAPAAATASPPPVAATGLLIAVSVVPVASFVAQRLVVAAFALVLGPFSATTPVLFALVAFQL